MPNINRKGATYLYKKIERLLKEKGVTVAEMCASTGIRQSVMSNLKSREGNLSFENAVKVADYLGIDLSELAKTEGGKT